MKIGGGGAIRTPSIDRPARDRPEQQANGGSLSPELKNLLLKDCLSMETRHPARSHRGTLYGRRARALICRTDHGRDRSGVRAKGGRLD